VPVAGLVTNEQKLAPQSIPFASIVGCLGTLEHASRRNTASSAGNRWPQGQRKKWYSSEVPRVPLAGLT
jgi:hypothetical protein